MDWTFPFTGDWIGDSGVQILYVNQWVMEHQLLLGNALLAVFLVGLVFVLARATEREEAKR